VSGGHSKVSAESSDIAKTLASLTNPPTSYTYGNDSPTDQRIAETLKRRKLTAKGANNPQPEIEQIARDTETVVQYYEGGDVGEVAFTGDLPDNAIYLNTGASEPLNWAFSHESIHVAQKRNAAEYERLERDVMGQLSKREQNAEMPDFSATIWADLFESPILFALSPLKADLSESVCCLLACHKRQKSP